MPSCHGWCGEPTQYPDTAYATPQEVQTQDTINMEMWTGTGIHVVWRYEQVMGMGLLHIYLYAVTP